MELDKRIKEGKRPLTCLDVEQAREFEGKECVFSDNYENFKNIDKYTSFNSYYTAILELEDKAHNGDYVFKNAKNALRYRLILPCEWVEEEQTLPKIDFESAKKDPNFELCELYGNELLYDTKNHVFYTSDGKIHYCLTLVAQRYAREEHENKVDVMTEKKYRPYTIKDFEKAFLKGEFEDFIIFRDKNYPEDVYTMIYNGNFKKGDLEYICLGAKNFSFESLFENYEVANYDGDFVPFGVLEE